jgi:hypothetical protein
MARDRDLHVEVDGVEHVRLCLGLLDDTSDHQADNTTADTAEMLAHRVREIFPMGPAEYGHARSSIGVDHVEGSLSATVHEGSAQFPYVGWLEFGGWVGWRGIPHRNHRKWIKGGRYLFPTLRTVWPGLEPRMHEALRVAAREAGWDPDG